MIYRTVAFKVIVLVCKVVTYVLFLLQKWNDHLTISLTMSLKQNMQVFVSFVNFVYDNVVGENMKMSHNVQVQKTYDPKEVQLLSKRSSCWKYRGVKDSVRNEWRQEKATSSILSKLLKLCGLLYNCAY